MKYVGIDVGKNKYFIIWYSSNDRKIIKENEVNNCKAIKEILPDKNCIIAIDSPSGYCDTKNKRRICEEELGIGGYYKTPRYGEKVQPWMKSGFELWNYLQKKHFKRAKYINKSKPVSKNHLIEVHPTIIFKKLQNSKEANSKKWIGCREPINKKRSVGKKQRREKLHLLFPNQKSVIENLKIDYIDALIAAYTAEQALKGNAIAFGDPGEGQIWFPNR